MLSILSSLKPSRLVSAACTAVAVCASIMGIASCSMMTEDLEPCPTRDTGLFVRFVYDYNIQRADMFKDHVGYVQLNIFDEAGKLVAQRTVSNDDVNAPLATYGYTMHFTGDELPAGHKYRLQAIGLQKDWDEATKTPGAKYRMVNAVKDTASVRIALDYDKSAVYGTNLHHVSDVAPLDTLWHTLKVTTDGIIPKSEFDTPTPAPARTVAPYSVYPIADQLVSVEEDYATYATVSMIRDTKHINITVRQLDLPADLFEDDYEVTIVDDNAIVGSDNALMPCDSVLYTPYKSWTTRYDPSGLHMEGKREDATINSGSDNDADVQRAAHYDMMVNRLIYNESDKLNAKLCLRKHKTGEIVALINLPSILAEARTAYEFEHYGPQEYLDREYDYRLQFFLVGARWAYISIDINVLGWTKRVYNLDL